MKKRSEIQATGPPLLSSRKDTEVSIGYSRGTTREEVERHNQAVR